MHQIELIWWLINNANFVKTVFQDLQTVQLHHFSVVSYYYCFLLMNQSIILLASSNVFDTVY